MSWVRHAALHGPSHILDGNIFWPHHHALLYSDTLIPLAGLFGLMQSVTRDVVTAFNATLVLLMLLNCWSVYLFARWLGATRWASRVGGLSFGVSSFFISHVGHMNLQAASLLVLTLYLATRLLTEPRWQLVPLFALAATATVLCDVYLAGAAGVALLGIVAVAVICWRRNTGRSLAMLLAAGALCAAACAPVALGYLSLQRSDNFRRTIQPSGGLGIRDLIAPADGSYLYSHVLPAPRDLEHRFFPGFAALGLASIGIAVLLRRSGREAGEWRRRALGSMAAGAISASIFALGDTVHGRPGPFRLLRYHVPGFAGIRVPARFAVVGLILCSLLVAVGLDTVRSRFSQRGGRALCVLCAAVIALEALAPVTALPFDHSTRALAAYRALAHLPSGPVVELPMRDPRFADGAFLEAPRMVYSTADFHPRVNGYSGFAPADYIGRMETLSTFPAPSALQLLAQLHVRYVLIHSGQRNGVQEYTLDDARRILANLPAAATVQQFQDDWLVMLSGVSR